MKKSMAKVLLVALLFGGASAAEAGWEEGVAAFKSGNLDAAASNFEEVVAKQPEWPGGHYMLGQVLLQQNKRKDALEHLKKAYELNPSDISYQYALGQAYLQNGRYSESAQMLKKINVASLPKAQQGNYQKMLAAALERSGDSGAAFAAMKKAAEANPNDAGAWYNYGTAAFNSGDTAAGARALEKATQLDSGDPEKQKTYAKVLIRQGRETRGSAKTAIYAKAASAAQKVVSSKATYDNLLLLAEAQLGAKQYDGAVTTLNRAVGASGADWLGHYYLSQALTSKGSFTQAESAARQALSSAARDSDKKRVWSQIGFVNEKLKKYDEAILAYNNAGDAGGAQRVSENKRISEENREIEQENEEIRRLEEERRRLEEELKELPGGR